jgi:arginine-tRNA-protein transferase
MLVEVYQPKSLSPSRLDKLLAGGWFRTSSSISRLQYLCIDGTVGSVINIRAKLANYVFSKSFRKLLAKNKKRFTHIIRKASIDEVKEMLYQKQKSRFEIFVMENLHVFLYDYLDAQDCVFDTYEIAVYDGDKLVAVSFFDLGLKSVASILGLYDHDYQKYSLGSYTMLLEIEYAKANGFTCYYPGYVVLSNKGYIFDYKLRLANLEYRNILGEWKPISGIQSEYWIHQVLEEKRKVVKALFEKYHLDYQEVLYPYFAIANFITHYQCVSTAIYFKISERHHQQLILEYLIEEGIYRVGYVSPLNDIFIQIMIENVKLSDRFVTSGNYFKSPLKYEDIALETMSLPQAIAKILELKIFEG